MTPKTSIQKKAAELSATLPPLTQVQKTWAEKHCFEHLGRWTRTGEITCLECAHVWQSHAQASELLDGVTCPHCGTKLSVNFSRKQKYRDFKYLCVITVCGELQVVRFFYVIAQYKVGQKADYTFHEVVQRWIAPDGSTAVLALLRPPFCQSDTWCFGGCFEIRSDKELYDILPHFVYPRQKVIPEIRKRGFKGGYYDLTPFELFHAILTDNRAETLLKTRQTGLLFHFVRRGFHGIENYWPSIRICNRNGYIVKDGSMWCDYINTLVFFKKDIRSPKYVCPENLKKRHDKLEEKRLKQEDPEKYEWQKAQRRREEMQFRKLKGRFFGLLFSDDIVQICVLESIDEYRKEGKALHHCVGRSSYYLNADSLVLSARVNGKRAETVEVSLRTLKIIQCRGACNLDSLYHARIVRLVNKNIGQIAERLAA